MSAFDVLLYCKSYERRQYEALKTRAVYMPLGYCDETHRPLPSADPRWRCQVGFLGDEPDAGLLPKDGWNA